MSINFPKSRVSPGAGVKTSEAGADEESKNSHSAHLYLVCIIHDYSLQLIIRGLNSLINLFKLIYLIMH